MLDDKTIIEVKNRDNGAVGYTIPDLGVSRHFQSGETKKLPMEELRKLSYIPGGMSILEDYLVIYNDDAIADLLGDVEPEYKYTEEDVLRLLTTGTIDEFLDCLDFAPAGVIELIKDLAVKHEVNDIAKRQAIKEKTGLDVTKAIEINHETQTDTVEPTKQRRTAVKTTNTAAAPAQRRTAPKYNVVKK